MNYILNRGRKVIIIHELIIFEKQRRIQVLFYIKLNQINQKSYKLKMKPTLQVQQQDSALLQIKRRVSGSMRQSRPLASNLETLTLTPPRQMRDLSRRSSAQMIDEESKHDPEMSPSEGEHEFSIESSCSSSVHHHSNQRQSQSSVKCLKKRRQSQAGLSLFSKKTINQNSMNDLVQDVAHDQFKEIQKINDTTLEESSNFEKILRGPMSNCQKDFDEEYRPYLESLSDVNQIPIFDTKEELTKPRRLERQLRDKFILELQKQNKIDNYEMKIRPMIQEIIDNCKQMEDLKNYSRHMHPATIAKIASQFDHLNSSCESQSDVQNDLQHSIISAQVEHYSYKKHEQFMIVKTIEQMQDNFENFHVIHTLRIYKEKVKSGIQRQKSQEDNLENNGPAIQSATLKNRFANFFQNKEFQSVGTVQDDSLNLSRYEIAQQVIVSDSGPLNKQLDKNQIGKFQQTTSILFHGKNLFYFQKNFRGNHSETIDYTIQQVDLQKIHLPQQFNIEIKGIFKTNNQQTSSIQIHWAQESQSKGKQLLFTDQELKALDDRRINFVKNQYIQIIDFQNTQQVLIYSLQDSNKCLSQGIMVQKGLFQKLLFNEIFVKRDCYKSEIKNILRDENESDQRQSKFLCFYNSCYLSLTLHEEKEDLASQCEVDLIYPYSKSPKDEKEGKGADENPMHQFKKMFLGKLAVNNNTQIQTGRFLKTQIKCLQSIHVLRYTPDGNNKNDHLKYFVMPKIPNQNYEKIKEDDYDEEKNKDGFSKQNNQGQGKKYMNLFYFIDEFGEVQIVHTQKEFKNMTDQQNGLEVMDHYYRQHIKSKIGHPDRVDKQQVKVTYVKDMLTYEDTRFAGNGLIEYFVKADSTFSSRDQQCISSHYMVAQTNQDQCLYIYKHSNLISHQQDVVYQADMKYSHDFTFDIIKIRHQNYKKKSSRQHDQILSYLNSYSSKEVNQIPQLRINKIYKGLISSWWGINYQNTENPSEQIQIDMIPDKEENTIVDQDFDQDQKLEFQEASIRNMVFETFDPPGKYFGINICSKKLIKHLEESHKSEYKEAKIKFFIMPKTYFVKTDHYYVILELKAHFKSKTQYFFTAENFLVKFKMNKSFAAYNESQQSAETANLLDLDTMVQFLECPKETNDTTDDNIKNEINQFKLLDLTKLADYNLFKSRFFDYDEQVMEDFSQVRFRKDQKQTLFQFEKIVDSKIENNLMPFISYQKDILPLGAPKNQNSCKFNDFMMQAFFFADQKMDVTPSIFINPKKIDRETINVDNQIQLWRCSDFFKSKDGTIVVHYKNSLILEQAIDRVQIQEFKLIFRAKNGNLDVYPIARTEKLTSSINTQIYRENLQIMQNKIEEQIKSKDKDVNNLKKNREQYSNNFEVISALAVDLLDFDDNGHLFDESKKLQKQKRDDLVPFNQAYRSPFLQFGYQKQNINDARCFELTLHVRLHDEFILKKIFNKYEVYSVFEQIIQTMLGMKPVLLQDFEFLLLRHYRSYEYQMQMEESFFQPQELFLGQSMCDINLNDPAQISKEISDMLLIKSRGELDDNEEEKIEPGYKGSLFDHLTQNNPYTEELRQSSQLQIEDYLILSKDFNFKTQLMRSLDINAENSYMIIVESIHKINSSKYNCLLENDMFKIMDKPDISEIYDYFDISEQEEVQEMKSGKRNIFCNFEQSLHHDDLPTVWKPGGDRLPMHKFRDPQNQNEEIIKRISKIGQSYDEGKEDIIQVQHKFVDFQKVSLGEKIRSIYEFVLEEVGGEDDMDVNQLTKCSMEEFDYIFDDLVLAQMMHQEERNREFYDLETAQQIVDAQFDHSRAFFLNLFLFYMVTFIAPLVVQSFVKNVIVTKICYSICQISMTLFFVIEVCQMRQLGMWEYLDDFWNIIDSSQFFVFGYLSYMKIFQSPEVVENVEAQTSTLEVYLLVFALFQAFLKGQSFVRIFDDCGFLVRMIGITMQELYPFIAFYSLYTMFFGIAFMILELNMDVREPTLDDPFDVEGVSPQLNPLHRRSASPVYPGINKIFAYILYSFRNSIGDLTTPNYDNWLLKYKAGKISLLSRNCVVSLAWGIWLFQAMFMVIILLNYLIAVIAQAYERVVNQRSIYGFIHKAEINLDYHQIMKQLNSTRRCAIKFMVFVEPCNMMIEKEDQNWHGFVYAIQKFIKTNDEGVKERFVKVEELISEQARKANIQSKNQHNQIVADQKQIKLEQTAIREILQERELEQPPPFEKNQGTEQIEKELKKQGEDIKHLKGNMKDVKKEIKDIKVMLAQIMEAVVKQPSQASSEN